MKPRTEAFLLFGSRFLGSTGFQFLLLGGSYFIFRETKSALFAGLGALALFAPALILPLLIGGWIDRCSRLGRIYLAIQVGFLACAALTAFFPSVPVVVGAFLIASVLRTLRTTSFYSMAQGLSRHFTPKHLALASTLSWQLPLIFAPALFSFVEGRASATILNGLPLVSFALAALAALPLRVRTTSLSRDTIAPSPFLTAGVRPWLEASIVDAVVMGSLVFTSLLPFLLDSAHADPGHLGYLRAALNIGVFVGAGLFGHLASERFAPALFQVSLVLACVVSFLSSWAHSSLALLAVCVLFGLCDSVSIVYRERLFFSVCREGVAGRLSTLGQLLNSCSEDGGEARAGLMAGFLGLQAGIQVSAAVGFLMLGIFIVRTVVSPLFILKACPRGKGHPHQR